MQNFRELLVWQKAHRLTLAVYKTTSTFPRDELYGLTSQLRRCSASIAANLAEGCGRNGNRELARFCSFAMGSASELEYHLLLAKDLALIESDAQMQLSQDAIELKRMLAGLMRKLKVES